MSDKLKKFIPLMILGGIILLGIGAYIIANRTGMPTKLATEPANFFLGFWHGLIIVLSLIASFFDQNIVLYQANNSGALYNVGYLSGILISIGLFGGNTYKKTNNKS